MLGIICKNDHLRIEWAFLQDPDWGRMRLNRRL